MREYFSEDAFRKRVFSFTDDNRSSLEKVKIGSKVSIRVKNEQGEIITISFRVTRNTHLGKGTVWIYGKVLDVPNGEYHQIELKLRKEKLATDTIEVFPQAPPAISNKLH